VLRTYRCQRSSFTIADVGAHVLSFGHVAETFDALRALAAHASATIQPSGARNDGVCPERRASMPATNRASFVGCLRQTAFSTRHESRGARWVGIQGFPECDTRTSDAYAGGVRREHATGAFEMNRHYSDAVRMDKNAPPGLKGMVKSSSPRVPSETRPGSNRLSTGLRRCRWTDG